MRRRATAAFALALLVALPGAAGGSPPPAPAAEERLGPSDALSYRWCPTVGPTDFGVVPLAVRCENGPVWVGGAVAHGFVFPPPGFSGRITSRLEGEFGAVRVFTCSTSWAQNTPFVGLVSPSITCGGTGRFAFNQWVTQTCTVEGLAPLNGGGQGLLSAGAWACYLGS